MSNSEPASPVIFRRSFLSDVSDSGSLDIRRDDIVDMEQEQEVLLPQPSPTDDGDDLQELETPAPPIRHSEFWLSDGSVVLQAQNVIFRVHKTFLARHSVVFRDMFAIPQPSSSSSRSHATQLELTDEEIEGCPVVHLYDSSEDVASLLYAIYDGPKFGKNDKADFRVVSGILRLASKYLIDSLRSKALEHLSAAWPSTLRGWDARERVADEHHLDSSQYYPFPVEVINLAREINAPTLLPSAFYDLSRYSLKDIFERSCLSSPSGPPLQLSLTDTQKLVLGKETAHLSLTSLIRSMASEARSNPNYAHRDGAHHLVHPPLTQPILMRGHLSRHRRGDSAHASASMSLSFRCSSPATCWRDVSELVDLATQHYLFDCERGAMDPLYVAEELAMLKGCESSNRNDDGETDCKGCARAFEVWAKREREKMWRTIPSWFRLDQL